MAKKKISKKARKTGGSARARINAVALIEALEQHVLGKVKMTSTQVNAALALLKKTLPDISGEEVRDKTPHEDALRELE